MDKEEEQNNNEDIIKDDKVLCLACGETLKNFHILICFNCLDNETTEFLN